MTFSLGKHGVSEIIHTVFTFIIKDFRRTLRVRLQMKSEPQIDRVSQIGAGLVDRHLDGASS